MSLAKAIRDAVATAHRVVTTEGLTVTVTISPPVAVNDSARREFGDGVTYQGLMKDIRATTRLRPGKHPIATARHKITILQSVDVTRDSRVVTPDGERELIHFEHQRDADGVVMTTLYLR